jgi:hypothetical protein
VVTVLEGACVVCKRHELTDNNCLCWSHDTRVVVNRPVHDAKAGALPEGTPQLTQVLEREQ